MPFKDIKGQERALEIIKINLDRGKLAGGYLFTGPESVGKKMSARVLSQALNCLQNTNDACGVCSSCIKIEKGQHPDVHIISSNDPKLKIEEIRQLKKDIYLRAYEGKFKVFIIDNAHTLTPEASNCLLKVLEEPPDSSLIILVTDKGPMLFKTIISRCKVVKFKAQKRQDLELILREGYNLDKGLAHFLAYFSEGKLGNALRLKDSDILRVRNNIIDRLMAPSLFDLAGLKIEDRKSFYLSLNILNTWFRDLYLMKFGMPQPEAINSDRSGELSKALVYFSISDLERILTAIFNTAAYLERNINTRLLLHNLKAQIWVS